MGAERREVAPSEQENETDDRGGGDPDQQDMGEADHGGDHIIPAIPSPEPYTVRVTVPSGRSG